MKENRTEIMPGVFLTYLPADKFKTGYLSAQFVTPLAKETASMNALLPAVLHRGTMGCPDMERLSAAMDRLYGAQIDPTVRKKGERQCVGFVAGFIDDSFAPRRDRILEPAAAARKHNLVTNFGKIMDPLADKILVYSAFCLMVAEGTVPGWMLIIILAREFLIAGMRTVAASEGIVIAAGMSGKIKTVLQMIAVPLLILTSALAGTEMFNAFNIAAQGFLWASLIMTVYSGVEYTLKNKNVFSM